MIESLIKELARARKYEAEEKAVYDEINAAIQTHYGKALERSRQYMTTAKADVAYAEEKLREAGIENFKVDGNKKPHDAFEIKEFDVLEYDEEKAFEHCRQHLPAALKMVKSDFEKVAKVAKLDFVIIKKEPRVMIKKDLGKWER